MTYAKLNCFEIELFDHLIMCKQMTDDLCLQITYI